MRSGVSRAGPRYREGPRKPPTVWRLGFQPVAPVREQPIWVRTSPTGRDHEEALMSKRARKKKARKKSGANHGKRPNS